MLTPVREAKQAARFELEWQDMKCMTIALFLAMAASAQEDHSGHANAIAGLGNVDFRTSCNQRAKQQMSRGVALLHSFGYEEARLAFERAASGDTSCGMAQWG